MKGSRKPLKHSPVYRVRSSDGGWEVVDRSDRRVSDRMSGQADAVVHAKELARRDGSAQIVVYGQDGHIASEFFYQREERPSLAYDDSTPSAAASHVATAGAVEHDPRSRGGRP